MSLCPLFSDKLSPMKGRLSLVHGHSDSSIRRLSVTRVCHAVTVASGAASSRGPAAVPVRRRGSIAACRRAGQSRDRGRMNGWLRPSGPPDALDDDPESFDPNDQKLDSPGRDSGRQRTTPSTRLEAQSQSCWAAPQQLSITRSGLGLRFRRSQRYAGRARRDSNPQPSDP